MAEITVKQLAQVVNRSVETVLIQIKEAGLQARGADDLVSDAEKQQLLAFLKRSHGDTSEDRPQITLKSKTKTTLKTPVSGGKAKTVNVEVRKTRTFVKPVENELMGALARKASDEAARKQLAEDAARKAAEEVARKIAEEEARKAAEQAAIAEEAARKAAEEAAKFAKVETPSTNSNKDKKLAAPKPSAVLKAEKKAETPEQKAKREAEAAKQRASEEARRKQEEATRKEAEEKARQRTLEQARRIAEELAVRGEVKVEDVLLSPSPNSHK